MNDFYNLEYLLESDSEIEPNCLDQPEQETISDLFEDLQEGDFLWGFMESQSERLL